MTLPRVTNQGVAIYAITLCCAMVFGAFWMSRGDHDLKLMSLQAVLTTGGTLLGIAGTLLVGAYAYSKLQGHDTADVPPGGVQTDTLTSTVQMPPISQPSVSATTSSEPPTADSLAAGPTEAGAPAIS